MKVKLDLPEAILEPLFSALNTIRPTECSRLEMKAIGLLKTMLYFELEKMMESPQEKSKREINFKNMFYEERERRVNK